MSAILDTQSLSREKVMRELSGLRHGFVLPSHPYVFHGGAAGEDEHFWHCGLPQPSIIYIGGEELLGQPFISQCGSHTP